MKKADVSLTWAMIAVALVSLSCALPVSWLTPETDRRMSETEAWQSDVDALKRIIRNQPIPNHLLDPDAVQTDAVFDPNQLLSPLDHLTLQPDTTLDFVYSYDGIGGKPFLYARPQTDLPFENYEDFVEAALNENQYLEFIACDGSEESYFQWVLLSMMGDQFYLYWHAGYHDEEIIASKARLETLVTEISTKEIGTSFTSSQKRQARKIDPAPVVDVGDEVVRVRVVWFTKWGGFYESTYTLSRSAPHQILDLETKNLMEYDCGIMF